MSDKRDAIIFDIDGTLSDPSHRRHHLHSDPPNWDAFFKGMGDDPPKKDIVWLLNRACQMAGVDVFIVSGRPEDYMLETLRWFEQHAADVHLDLITDHVKLYMRPKGDTRADTIVKAEILEKINETHKVRIVVDDRPSVVEMWRAANLTCLQEDSGEWDKRIKCKPGGLIMMIGPSGSGKSTLVKSLYEKEHYAHAGCILSSDQIRELLTGDFKDQSKNDQVFHAIQEIAKVRLESGLTTIIDATNIKSRDRRAIRNCAPADGRITYIVVDRPLDEKRRDAGWREKVVVKGLPLIEYHHQVFTQNLKSILSGDGDPRVTVIDKRKVIDSEK